MPEYLTSGQAAKVLRTSVSTLKRWMKNPGIPCYRNRADWILFAKSDIVQFQKKFKKKRFRLKGGAKHSK